MHFRKVDMEMNEKITLTKVKQMGFSDKLISLLLPEPELVDNPYYKSAAPMKLWNKENVEEAMKRDEYINYQEKRKKRQAAAEERRKQKKDLYDAVQQSLERIVVEVIPFDKLKQRVLWFNFRNKTNENTIRRWMVNYVKYKMTHYNDELLEIAEKTKNYDAYILLQTTILSKIAEAYPELKGECMQQIDNLLSKRNKRKMLEDNRKEKIFFEKILKTFSP